MPAPTATGTRFRLLLAAPAPQGRLAADLLAAATGVDAGLAAARLAGGPSLLAEGLGAAEARRLAALLPLFGLRVRVEPEGSAAAEAEETRFDLSVQCAGPADAPALAATLGLTVGEVREGLSRPGGLTLPGRDWAEVGALRARLCLLRGLRVAVSDPERATYDLIAWGRPTRPDEAAGLLRHSRRLGLGPCALTGAAVGGADRALRDHLLARFPGAGVIAVNRDFQRFDLLLTASPGLGERDLADFLASRGPHVASASGAGLCIERGLSRADTLCFQTDYAVIGIETRPVLVAGRPETSP